MTPPILTTKLHIPTPRPDLVSRPRLIEHLNTCSTRKLTLISAPAGFGKSTLLSACVQQIETASRVAWLSLDESDNDLSRFLTYFVAALQTVENDIGQGILTALPSLDEANVEFILTNLINEINQLTEDVILVLDDYHVIETPAIDQTLTFLLDHLPTQLHLVIASRIDPTLPLSRLRARRQMTEIRVNDLRFTFDEATDFLNQIMGFDLSTQDVMALGERTEGWIAGLQLAALAMQGTLSTQGFIHHSDLTAFVNRFTGSDRYIQDYLVDEVLQQQPQEIKDFLLQTSILTRLSGPLCDVVRFGNANLVGTTSQGILENLEAANLFIVPLDNERRWYRYHQLFADLLNHRLRMTATERIPKLHYWASYWYQRADYFDEAIWHAQAAKDNLQLADILEECWYIFAHRGELTKLLNLLNSLGAEITKKSAPLSMAYAWVYYLQNSLDQIPSYLNDIRKLAPDGVLTNYLQMPTEFAVIPAMVEILDAALALNNKDIEKVKSHAETAITLIPTDPNPKFGRLLRAAATYKLAEAHLALGNLDQACTFLLAVLDMLKASEDYFGIGNVLFHIVDVYLELGNNREAHQLCEDTLSYIEAHNWGKMPPSGIVYLILAGLQANSGAIKSAHKNLDIGRCLVEPIKSPKIMRLVVQVEGKLDGNVSAPQPLVEPLSERELEVLHLIAQGLTNREISERLYLALDTVKGHNRRIFGKLGVKEQIEAVEKARELGLLGS